MIALLMIGTKIISIALSVLRIPATVSMWIGQLPVDPWMIAVMIVLFYILLGMLIEGTSMFFLTFPVVFDRATRGLEILLRAGHASWHSHLM